MASFDVDNVDVRYMYPYDADKVEDIRNTFGHKPPSDQSCVTLEGDTILLQLSELAFVTQIKFLTLTPTSGKYRRGHKLDNHNQL